MMPVSAEPIDSPNVDPFLEECRPLVTLVVDDSVSQRKMLKLLMRNYGFELLEAGDGTEALEICRSRRVDIVISDWMMPKMTGPELCRALRADNAEHYIYFILLTSKREKSDVAHGLDAGADDFLSKPTDKGELMARMRAGQRILQMQEALTDKTRRITEAFDRLNQLYESIDRDLKAAGRLQKSLVPETQSTCEGAEIGIVYRPSGHVGGDLVGFVTLAERRVGVFSIDVSGHGVSAALMTARIFNLFDEHHREENVALNRLPDGTFVPREPSEIAAELNDRLQDDAESDLYFTMLYADIDLDTGLTRYCQAGHPNAAVMRQDGSIESIGKGGPPIGLLPIARYETSLMQLHPGERIMLFSDGITECELPDGTMIEEEGLHEMLRHRWDQPEGALLNDIVEEMIELAQTEQFEDDVSAIMLKMP